MKEVEDSKIGDLFPATSDSEVESETSTSIARASRAGTGKQPVTINSTRQVGDTIIITTPKSVSIELARTDKTGVDVNSTPSESKPTLEESLNKMDVATLKKLYKAMDTGRGKTAPLLATCAAVIIGLSAVAAFKGAVAVIAVVMVITAVAFVIGGFLANLKDLREPAVHRQNVKSKPALARGRAARQLLK